MVPEPREAPARPVSSVVLQTTPERIEGKIATITAGWQERELEDQELHEHLHGDTINLKIYERADRVWKADTDQASVDLMAKLMQQYGVTPSKPDTSGVVDEP